jgi:hypothetical protein
MSQLNYGQPSTYGPSGSKPLAAVGGALAIAGCVIGFLVLFASCAGLNASLMLSPLPILLGAIGFVLVIVGGITQKNARIEDTGVLAGMFLSVMAILGGLLEMSAWLGWHVLTGTK